MKLSEHNNFLNSKKEYQNAKDFWYFVFNNLKSGSFEYVENKFMNSEEIMDGNPLFSAIYKDNKAVRIIQNKITIHEPIFTCWIQKSILDKTEVNELVIYLQPLDYLFDDVEKLIGHHLNFKIPSRLIQKLNNKYQTKWDILRSKKIIRRLENLNLLNENINENFEINRDRLRDFSTIIAIENFYVNVASHKVINPVSSALQRVETRIQKLNNITTLKGSLVMRNAPKPETYNNKIKRQYSSKSNFKKNLKTSINNLKTEVAELKSKSEKLKKSK